MGMSIKMITHDLGVIAEVAHDVVVMYLGKIVERGPVRTIFHNAQHPYTKGLLNSVPVIGRKRRLTPIRGTVTSIYELPPGCSFKDRCPYVMPECDTEPPEFKLDDDHSAKCWLLKRGESYDGSKDIA